jgi:hypothetical protein
VCENNGIDILERHAELIQTLRGTTPGVEDKHFIAGLDQDARSKARQRGRGIARAEQCHAELLCARVTSAQTQHNDNCY